MNHTELKLADIAACLRELCAAKVAGALEKCGRF
jgi:hypothetical protein